MTAGFFSVCEGSEQSVCVVGQTFMWNECQLPLQLGYVEWSVWYSQKSGGIVNG